MPTEFKKRGEWRRFEKSLDAIKFDKVLKKHVRRSLEISAKFIVAQIREGIKRGDYAENALMTIEIKGSSKPLIDKGDLWKAITHEMVGELKAFIGLSQTERSGGNTYNIGIALHEGVTIRVTEKMRAMFWYLWLASVDPRKADKLTGRAKELFERQKHGWSRLEKDFIRIPGRPFIKTVFDNPVVRDRVFKLIAQGFDAGLREQAGGM